MWKHRTVQYWATCDAELIIQKKNASCSNHEKLTAQNNDFSPETFPICSSLGAEYGYVWISAIGNAARAEQKTKGSLPFSWRIDNPRSWGW